jgi:hypothetical protein
MGLDVYLYKCANIAHAIRMEERYSREEDKIYDERKRLEDLGQLTEEADAALLKRRLDAQKKYGMRDYRHESIERIHRDSKTQPDHLFKIGYLRSSYNSTGINRLANHFDLPSLYDIFDIHTEEYEQQIDWDAIYPSVKDAVEKWQAFADSPRGKYDVFEFHGFMEHGVKDEREAFERFNQEYLVKKEEIDKDEFRRDGWRGREGDIWPTGLKVVMMVAAKWNPLKPIQYGNWPSTYVVYEREDNSIMQWYVTALQIAQEMVEWILEQPDKDQYFMGWSG